MAENKITLGPWNAVKESPSNRFTIFGPKNSEHSGKIARVHAHNAQANAQAIAAVPELLDLAIAIDRGASLQVSFDLADKALDKAGIK